MMKMPIEPGRVVRSLAGRDAGRRFAVLRADDTFAYLADGDLRKVEKPKKKKIRHLRATPAFYASVAAILTDGKLPSNADIRKALAESPQRED
ncbi:MAG: KOW domain-containing RNA-binding protein [Oscillospiraceae bacterium]|jgi:ribosomal protein L14E/L6E/L27E|nr:KOW domain-containing RNA-binding protein [Oscillospiraceae bacterium]